MKVRFTPSARQQFLDGLAYIRRDKPSAARNFRKRTQRVLRRLEDYPLSGRTIPEFPALPHREVIINPYRFFYRMEKKTVWIVAVLHSAQEVDSGEDSV
ncbi:MAG: type II toxin-antitoxin system RelE/ParE family toxin [Nitrospirae bacterium]|nr:type II toxin-antitoxin system RelE/ParE family toxin [Nitrospirota bacterium]MDA1302951.1 type II toxin-antitoxin system RelE/ParE family toxin [Nitrospirota bacterium]